MAEEKIEISEDVLARMASLNKSYDKYAASLLNPASNTRYAEVSLPAALYKLRQNKIASLSLDGLDIGSERNGAASLALALSSNSSVHTLSLRKTNLGESGALAVVQTLIKSKHRHLRNLALDENELGDGTMQALAQYLTESSGLHKLTLTRNAFSVAGLTSFCAALKKDTSLRQCDLCHNTFGDEGVTPVCEVIVQNQALRALWCCDSKMTDAGALQFAAVLGQLKTRPDNLVVHFSQSKLVTAKGLEAIAQSVEANPALKAELGGGEIAVTVLSDAHLERTVVVNEHTQTARPRISHRDDASTATSTSSANDNVGSTADSKGSTTNPTSRPNSTNRALSSAPPATSSWTRLGPVLVGLFVVGACALALRRRNERNTKNTT